MKPLTPQPGLTEQVYRSLLDSICDGTLAPGMHLVQEQLAAELRVSRQPVQQALAILKSEDLVLELGRRGLFVAPLDVDGMQQRYEVRAALDGLAARRAATLARRDQRLAATFEREGAGHIAAGQAAIASGSVTDLVERDVAFHGFIYDCSGNPLLAPAAAPHWRHLRRIMSGVVLYAEPPTSIWRQHAEILAAIVAGDAREAERLAVDHVETACARLEAALSRSRIAEAHQPSPSRRQA